MQKTGDDNLQPHLNTAQVPQMQNLSSMTNILKLGISHSLLLFSLALTHKDLGDRNALRVGEK